MSATDEYGPAAVDLDEEEELIEEVDDTLDVPDIVDPTTTQEFSLRKLYQQHPECLLDFIEATIPKLDVTQAPAGPPATGTNGDPNHRTRPWLTDYERTRIIGFRANQLSKGMRPFIRVPEHITDVREIAAIELEQKRLPYILKRPLPNGQFEYWRLVDLLIL